MEKYQQAVRSELVYRTSLTAAAQADLRELQNILGLKDENVALIRAKEIRRVRPLWRRWLIWFEVIGLVFCQTYLDGLGCRGRPTCLPKIATLRADTSVCPYSSIFT